MLQLVYGLDTYDHVMCVHFHHPLDMKLSTWLQLVSTMISSSTIVVPLGCDYVNTTVVFFVIGVQLLY